MSTINYYKTLNNCKYYFNLIMITIIEYGHKINPQEWDSFIYDSPQGNIYHTHMYLSNLLPNWQSIIVRDDNLILAALPLKFHSKWGLQYAMQPFFAQYIGIVFRKISDNMYKELEHIKKVIQIIHRAIPGDIKFLNYNFAPEFHYELPLKWLGWKQRTLYTYWVDIKSGYDEFIQNAASHVRRELKKVDQHNFQIVVDNDPETVVSILKESKPEVVRNIPEHYFNALCKNSRHFYESGRSVCFIAKDKGKPIAGIIYFFYKRKMIYYQGSALPDYKNSGVMSKIIAESVRLRGQGYDYLDFDGSMIESIERFFRGFGAFPVHYSNFILNRLPFVHNFIYQIKSTYRS